jgi:REP element-mobilizing transposase RayT
VRGDVDRDRLVDHVGRAAVRCSWRVYAFAAMPNHLHVVLKTPHPNLARGMPVFLCDQPRRFTAWLATEAKPRDRLRGLQRELCVFRPPELT